MVDSTHWRLGSTEFVQQLILVATAASNVRVVLYIVSDTLCSSSVVNEVGGSYEVRSDVLLKIIWREERKLEEGGREEGREGGEKKETGALCT